MKKLKRFILSASCETICNESMAVIVGGEEISTPCNFSSPQEKCSGMCSYEGLLGTCTYRNIEDTQTKGCYCYID